MKKIALFLTVLAISVGSLFQTYEERLTKSQAETFDLEISKMLKRQTLPWSIK